MFPFQGSTLPGAGNTMESRNRCGPALLELTGYCSVTQSCPILCSPMDCSMPGFPVFTVSWSLLKLIFIESVMRANHLVLCRSLLLLPSVFPSIRVFSNESALCIRWWKYWRFSFSISPSNDYSRLISFRIDWFDLLAVQGTLKSLLQDHNSKASVLQCSAFFMVHHIKLMTGPHSGYFKETRRVPTKLWN